MTKERPAAAPTLLALALPSPLAPLATATLAAVALTLALTLLAGGPSPLLFLLSVPLAWAAGRRLAGTTRPPHARAGAPSRRPGGRADVVYVPRRFKWMA